MSIGLCHTIEQAVLISFISHIGSQFSKARDSILYFLYRSSKCQSYNLGSLNASELTSCYKSGFEIKQSGLTSQLWNIEQFI
jgi:hypothetical protein